MSFKYLQFGISDDLLFYIIDVILSNKILFYLSISVYLAMKMIDELNKYFQALHPFYSS